jgi:GNAT superfamily N-acetyltransferase
VICKANISRHEIAKEAASRFGEKLRILLDGLGIRRDAYELEMTSCQSAEGPEFEARTDCVYLDQVTVFENRRGLGGRLMRVLLRLADELGLTVVLNAASQKFDERDLWWIRRLTRRKIKMQAYRFTALSQEELVAWYLRLGFVFADVDSGLMVRRPGMLLPPPKPRD